MVKHNIASVEMRVRFSLPAQGKKPRLLIRVPKRIIRLAVHRNRIKRQIRERYRKQVKDKNIIVTVIRRKNESVRNGS